MTTNDTAKELRDLQGGMHRSAAGVRPIRWGELADVIEIFTPGIEAGLQQFGDLFGWLVEQKIIVPGKAVRLDSQLAMQVMSQAMPLLGQVPELLRAVQRFTAIASDRNLEDIEALGMDEGLNLALAAYEANQDFFRQRLLPLLRAAWVRTSGKFPVPTPAAAGAADGELSSRN